MPADIEEARYCLREWAYYFRDRRRRLRTGSAEGAWRSPQCWYPVAPKPDYSLLRAIQTWSILRGLPVMNYRALTWRFCYPQLPLGIPLRALSRRAGYRINQREYENLVTLGEIRVAVALDETHPLQETLIAVDLPKSAARRASPNSRVGAFVF